MNSTDTNQASEDELDEILESLTTGASDGQFIDDGSIGEAKVDILDWHNKQTLELLDRLDKETERCQDGCWVSIEAERNKLKGETK